MEEIRSLLEEWLVKNKCSKKDLQSLLGKLQFVASCVRPGSVFTMRLLALLRQIPKNGSVLIPEEARADLRWWRCFMEKYNGISMMPDSPWSEPDQVFAMAACLEGSGGWCSSSFFHGEFPQFIKERHLHINALELLTVMVALILWGKFFHGKRISILCDNIAYVIVLNRGITRNKFQTQCLREITFITAVGEFQVRAQHIPGTDNRIPDILIRWHSFQDPFLKLQELTQGFELSETAVDNDCFQFSSEWLGCPESRFCWFFFFLFIHHVLILHWPFGLIYITLQTCVVF